MSVLHRSTNDHLSRTDVAVSLKRPTWKQTGQVYCSLFGLASDGVYICPACYQPGGSPLHCLSTLTALSVSGKTAVYFCCTVLGVASTRRYLASCPVKPGLSSPAPWKTDYSACPYRSSDHLPYSDRNYVITVLFFCPAYEPNSQFSV